MAATVEANVVRQLQQGDRMLRAGTLAVVAVGLGVTSGVAHADVPPSASNMGLCSAFLAHLDVPGQGNIPPR
jgi:hypothetical protein